MRDKKHTDVVGVCVVKTVHQQVHISLEPKVVLIVCPRDPVKPCQDIHRRTCKGLLQVLGHCTVEENIKVPGERGHGRHDCVGFGGVVGDVFVATFDVPVADVGFPQLAQYCTRV